MGGAIGERMALKKLCGLERLQANNMVQYRSVAWCEYIPLDMREEETGEEAVKQLDINMVAPRHTYDNLY